MGHQKSKFSLKRRFLKESKYHKDFLADRKPDPRARGPINKPS